MVRLDWCTGDALTVSMTGGDASHLDLLAIPPDTPTIIALACLARAARELSPPDRAGAPAGMQPATAPDGRYLHGLPSEPAPVRYPIHVHVDRPVGQPRITQFLWPDS